MTLRLRNPVRSLLLLSKNLLPRVLPPANPVDRLPAELEWDAINIPETATCIPMGVIRVS